MKLKITPMLFCVVLTCNLSAQVKDTRGIITARPLTEKFQYIPYTGPTGPPENTKPDMASRNADSGGPRSQVTDSLIIEDIIPAGTTYRIKYDHLLNTFTKISPVPDLTPGAIAAINCSPKWLRNDLYDNFRRLDTSLQSGYAQVIINADTLVRDEVAFQVAHLSTNMTLPTLDKLLPLVNAQGIYQNAPDLQYVKLVEHGSAIDGDWYTTTSYRIVDALGDTVWREVPRDVYYWYVLMPIVYEEQPLMDSTVYNEFWRTYVYNHADIDSGATVLKNVLSGVKVYWDGQNHHWDNVGQPFGDSLTAVEALGRWVSQTIIQDAIPPRPVQPNLALHDHNGNCGEIQDLQTSGGRSGLIPLMPICSWPGDHVWNEVYWPDSAKWAFYQVARVNGPTDVNWTQTWPTSACITAMRADGYRYMVNEHYNPVCTVTVVVKDKNGKPVDGAEVVFLATPYFDVHSLTQSEIGYWGHTDENGQLTTQIATDFNYFIRTDWANGHYPTNSTLFYSLLYVNITEGDHKWIYLTNGVDSAEDKKYNVVPAPQPGNQSTVVEYEVPYHVTYGGGFWNYPSLWEDDFIYANKTDDGSINSFICDSVNNYRYYNDTMFDAYSYFDSLTTGNMSLNMSDQEDYYIGFSNRSKMMLAEFARIKVYLNNGPVAVPEYNPENGIKIYPNPSNGFFYIENLLTGRDDEQLEVTTSLGSLVYKSDFSRGEKYKKVNLSTLSKGIYLARIYNAGNSEVRKFIIQ